MPEEPCYWLTISSAESVRVEVHDDSELMPYCKNYDPESATGKGLPLLDQLTSRWGAERVDGGKVVWFVFKFEEIPE